MTDFVQEQRHYCRNPKCKSKLKVPVQNPREAFCARGCHGSFYLKRCRVCEDAIEQSKGRRRLICRKAKCRSAFRANSGFGRYHVADLQKTPSKTPDFIESKVAPARGRAWHIVLTPDQLHCATVPDGPAWADGPYQRIEAQNRALLREHFRKKTAECLIQPHHPPVNILGGYKFPGAPEIELNAPKPAVTSSGITLTDDLSIPAFLKRA